MHNSSGDLTGGPDGVNSYDPSNPMYDLPVAPVEEPVVAPPAPAVETPAVADSRRAAEPASTTVPSEETSPDATVVEPAVAPAFDEAMYARRRRRLTWLVIAAVIVGAFIWHPWKSSDEPSSVTSPAKPSATAQINSDMETLHNKLMSSGTLDGVQLNGSRIAASGTTAYVTRDVAGLCYVYGIKGGADIIPVVDTSGSACTDSAMEALRTQMSSTPTTPANSATSLPGANQGLGAGSLADSALTSAAQQAKLYGSYHYRNSVPDLTGLSSTNLGGVEVTQNQGSYATLQTSIGGVCRTAIVSNLGDLGEISDC